MINYMSFHPVKRNPNDSLVGFCSFKWSQEFQFTEIAVHKLLRPRGNIFIRLLYPEKARPKGVVYQEILEEVNAYVLANYKEAINDNN